MRKQNIEERVESRVYFEQLEDWVRERIQGYSLRWVQRSFDFPTRGDEPSRWPVLFWPYRSGRLKIILFPC